MSSDLHKQVAGARRRRSPFNPLGEVASLVIAFGAGTLFHFLLKKVWLRAFGHEAPTNPTMPGVGWSESLAWGLATGAAAGAAKVIARRGADVAQQRLS